MPEIATENPVELSEALVKNYKPQLFFRNRFKTITHSTQSFLIDINKKTRHMAPYVRDDLPGKKLDRDGYDTLTFTPPNVAPTRDITHKDMQIRRPGEGIVEIGANNDSEEQRAFNLVLDDAFDLQESIERREEQQCAEVLSTGKITVKGDGYDGVIESPIPEGNIITLPNAKLFSAADSKPWETFDGFDRKILKNGGASVADIIFGSAAWDATLGNANFQAVLDKKNIDLGNVTVRPDQIYPGVKFRGVINGYNMWTYDEYVYDTETEKDIAMVPTDRVILIGGNPRLEMHYGAIFDAALGTINKTKSYAYSWVNEGKPRTKNICVEAAPLALPVNGSAIISAKVV